MINFIRSGQSAHPLLKGSGKILSVTIGEGLPASTREYCISLNTRYSKCFLSRPTFYGSTTWRPKNTSPSNQIRIFENILTYFVEPTLVATHGLKNPDINCVSAVYTLIDTMLRARGQH